MCEGKRSLYPDDKPAMKVPRTNVRLKKQIPIIDMSELPDPLIPMPEIKGHFEHLNEVKDKILTGVRQEAIEREFHRRIHDQTEKAYKRATGDNKVKQTSKYEVKTDDSQEANKSTKAAFIGVTSHSTKQSGTRSELTLTIIAEGQPFEMLDLQKKLLVNLNDKEKLNKFLKM